MHDPNKMYMEMAIKYAKSSSDSPKVGAVIVLGEEVVGFGYRQKISEGKDPNHPITFHAEQTALLMAGDKADGAALYTTLEPCIDRAHSGNQPVMDCCVNLIEKSGIEQVVIGLLDSNNNMRHKGVRTLQDLGITVVLEHFGLYKELKGLRVDYRATSHPEMKGFGAIKKGIRKLYMFDDEEMRTRRAPEKRLSPALLKARYDAGEFDDEST